MRTEQQGVESAGAAVADQADPRGGLRGRLCAPDS